jgi:hypothetical protein
MEGKVDRKEYEALLVVIEQTIGTSASKGAEHFRGYRRETRPPGVGRMEEANEAHDRPCDDSDVDSGDSYLDAIGRMYRVSCRNRRKD